MSKYRTQPTPNPTDIVPNRTNTELNLHRMQTQLNQISEAFIVDWGFSVGLVRGKALNGFSKQCQRPMSLKSHLGIAYARKAEWPVYGLLLASALVSVLVTLAIVLSVLSEALAFFRQVPFMDFLTGLKWSPQTALRADQGGSSGAFGAVPLFMGTLLITLIALAVALPVGLFSAIFLTEYAPRRLRAKLKPALELLAGIPTVIYGYFAIILITPLLQSVSAALGFSIASESALAAGLVMGIMIIPFVSSLSDDIIASVPQALRDASLAMGATKSETIKRVVLPAAMPGIIAACLLAFSRAVGETMIVVMAAGLAANLSFNPLDAVTTVTVQIVSLLVGDQSFDSPKTLAAFALGLTLFVFTLALNAVALRVVAHYKARGE